MRKIIAVVLALICVLGLVGCSSEPKTFEIEGAEKLIVMSGATGESIDITNADDIKYITDNINALNFSKGEKVNSDGWSYSLQWYDKNGDSIENLALLGDGYTVIYDGYYYKGMTVDYEIDLTFLDGLFANSSFKPSTTQVSLPGGIHAEVTELLDNGSCEVVVTGEDSNFSNGDTLTIHYNFIQENSEKTNKQLEVGDIIAVTYASYEETDGVYSISVEYVDLIEPTE